MLAVALPEISTALPAQALILRNGADFRAAGYVEIGQFYALLPKTVTPATRLNQTARKSAPLLILLCKTGDNIYAYTVLSPQLQKNMRITRHK